MFAKNRPDFGCLKAEVKKVKGQLAEAHRNYMNHLKEHNCR